MEKSEYSSLKQWQVQENNKYMKGDNEEPWLECTVTTAISTSPRRKPALVPNTHSEMPGALGSYSTEINKTLLKERWGEDTLHFTKKNIPKKQKL